MKTFIIDTNAMLSYVTDRNLDQQEKVAVLFNQAAGLKCKILCHQHVITEFVYVLDKVYNQSKSSIRQMILDFLQLPGIELKHDVDFSILLRYWPDSITDFGDGVVASLWNEYPEASIVTFDKRFIAELEKIGATLYKGDSQSEL
jgi:predicted nucleic-acid-binding protein